MPVIMCIPGQLRTLRMSQPTRSSGQSSCSAGKDRVATATLETKEMWPAFLMPPRSGSGAHTGWEWECSIHSPPKQKRQQCTAWVQGLLSLYFYLEAVEKGSSRNLKLALSFPGIGVSGQGSSLAACHSESLLPLPGEAGGPQEPEVPGAVHSG